MLILETPFRIQMGKKMVQALCECLLCTDQILWVGFVAGTQEGGQREAAESCWPCQRLRLENLVLGWCQAVLRKLSGQGVMLPGQQQRQCRASGCSPVWVQPYEQEQHTVLQAEVCSLVDVIAEGDLQNKSPLC